MRKNSARKGSALILAVVVVILAAGLGGAFWSMSISSSKSSQKLTDEAEVQMICDAGLEMARAALVKWRNADPYKKEGDSNPVYPPTQYAWNKIFKWCQNGDGTRAGTRPGMGAVASPDVIREDAMSRLNGTVQWDILSDRSGTYNFQTVNHTVFGDIQQNPWLDDAAGLPDQCIQELFCVNRRYGNGAYHITMRNNQPDQHGNGIDNQRPPSGNPWKYDSEQFTTSLDANGVQVKTSVYPGDPSLGPNLPTDPLIDGDGQCILTITATLTNGTCRQIEVFLSYPYTGGGPVNAIQDNGDIKMSGNFKVLGQLGKVHANGNVTGNGSNGSMVSQGVTAAGDASGFTMGGTMGPGGIQSGQPPVPINAVDMNSFIDSSNADFSKYKDLRQNMYELRKDGTVRVWSDANASAPSAVHAPGTFTVPGIKFTNNTTEPWKLDTGNNAAPIGDATYWIEGNWSMQGNDNGTVTQATFLVTGSVDMQGSARYAAATNKVTNVPIEQLIVAGADVRLRGTATSGNNYTGAIFANEQVAISGTFNMNGSITAANVTDSPLSAVTSNSTVAPDLTVQGTPTVIYDGAGSIIKQSTDHLNVKGLHRTR